MDYSCALYKFIFTGQDIAKVGNDFGRPAWSLAVHVGQAVGVTEIFDRPPIFNSNKYPEAIHLVKHADCELITECLARGRYLHQTEWHRVWSL
mmetsp:Transcript_45935/g.92700  ORF Transcript_45935/g.92700 Transcript_45935/m.92700 type:complete len:93 (-) Transcript_45935:854-1132(-)|eukprot:CAMPEP_0171676044 /NCGR_PEP_ID=MMETSP0990-20121206/54181_1 /TAXON_ID=483369 /ORGANISM="non described non described, Strain CCMP2098" /LENGTH=92 /DNA_ID=CAMNT_0012262111 /DNA_START=476 /DNA_END=754 /DNA_ORIENTATION=-